MDALDELLDDRIRNHPQYDGKDEHKKPER